MQDYVSDQAQIFSVDWYGAFCVAPSIFCKIMEIRLKIEHVQGHFSACTPREFSQNTHRVLV